MAKRPLTRALSAMQRAVKRGTAREFLTKVRELQTMVRKFLTTVPGIQVTVRKLRTAAWKFRTTVQKFPRKLRRRFTRKTGWPATGAGTHGPRAPAGVKPGSSPVRQHLTRLRVTTVILLLLALAGAALPLPSRRQQVVMMLDVSESIDRREQERARRAALGVLADLSAHDRAAVVTFAGGQRILTPPVAPENAAAVLAGAALTAPAPEKTNLYGALRLAGTMFEAGAGAPSIILFSDGRPTAGGEAGIFPPFAEKVRIHAVPVGTPATGLYSSGLELPEIARPGEEIGVGWRVFSDRLQEVTVGLKLNGQTVGTRRVKIAAGSNRLQLPLTAPASGLARVELEVAGEDGRALSMAGAAGLLRVGAAAQILVLTGDSPSLLATALRAQGMTVTEENIAGFAGARARATPGELASYAAVVLENIPAYALTKEYQDDLGDYVAGGGGLLVTGGEKALGRGEYYASRLEELLPVRTDTRQRLLFDRLKMLFLIDQSGSMSQEVGGISKQEAAVAGLLAAAAELNPWDEVGILGFEDKADWILPFTPVGDGSAIQAAARRISPGGGTNLAAGLEAAIRGFAGAEAARRHMVIISDGMTISADFAGLSRRLREMRVTVTTIGVGHEINEPLLRDLAGMGEGEFYRADEASLPRIIVAETFRVTRELIQEGTFTPVLRTPADFLGGLPDPLPPVRGYLRTTAKQTAEVYLEVGEGDPLLAAWRYGNGRVAVLTADTGRRWLSAWIHRQFYNRFFGQLVRFLERGLPDEGIRVFTTLEAGTARLVVEATSPDRRLRPGLQLAARNGQGATFRLRETAAGRYETVIPLDEPGLHLFTVYEINGENWNTGWVFNPPGLEHRQAGPDTAFLERLSSLSGGRSLTLENPEMPEPLWSWRRVPLRRTLTFLALILFVAELIYRSSFLGQPANAWATLQAWWWRQQLTVEEMTKWEIEDKKPGVAKDYLPEVGLSYRYLARRRKDRSREGRRKGTYGRE
ncbi:MAG: VWA domain-containing protein [Firmicutes bacterium]|nr:VWA domain-containing protein [Bacillota bacterium]